MKEHIWDIIVIISALAYAMLRIISKNKKNAAKAKRVIAQRETTVGEQSKPGTTRPVSSQQSTMEGANPWDVFKRILELEEEDRSTPEVVETELAMERSMPMEEGGRATIAKNDWKFDEDEIGEQDEILGRQLSFADYKKMEAEQRVAKDASDRTTNEKSYFDDDIEETYNDIINDFNISTAVLYSEILNPKY